MVGVFRIIQCIIYPFSSSTTVLPWYGPYLILYQHITVKCACKITWHAKNMWRDNIYHVHFHCFIWSIWPNDILFTQGSRKYAPSTCESTCIARTLYLWEVEDWVKSGRVMRSVSQAHPHNHRHPDHRLHSSIIIYIHIYSYIFICGHLYSYNHLYSSKFIYIHLCSSIFICIYLYSSILIYIHLYSSIFIYIYLYSSVFIYVHLYSSILIYIHLF